MLIYLSKHINPQTYHTCMQCNMPCFWWQRIFFFADTGGCYTGHTATHYFEIISSASIVRLPWALPVSEIGCRRPQDSVTCTATPCHSWPFVISLKHFPSSLATQTHAQTLYLLCVRDIFHFYTFASDPNDGPRVNPHISCLYCTFISLWLADHKPEWIYLQLSIIYLYLSL